MIPSGSKVNVSIEWDGRISSVSGSLNGHYAGSGPVEVFGRDDKLTIVPADRVIRVDER